VTRLLVLTGVEVEAQGLARRLGLPRVARSPWPHFAGGALAVVCIGLRASRLRGHAEQLPGCDLVISAGACGALAPQLTVGDLVVPETVIDAAGGRWPTAALRPVAAAGTLLTVGDVIETAAQKSRLWLETGARAVDMESAPILAWAAERRLPGAVVRAVSDDARRGVPAALAASVRDDGRLRPLRAVTAVLTRPASFADLRELRSGTQAALTRVAGVLATLARQA
jgi:hypothetical protein